MIVLEQIKIDSTDTTPQIVLDVSSLNFSFCGVSMPNDPVKFYAPIIQWLKEYQQNPIKNAKFKIELEYFNTASSKIILNIMKMIRDIGNGNKIIWMYDKTDSDIKEVGEDYQEMIGEDVLEVIPIDD